MWVQDTKSKVRHTTGHGRGIALLFNLGARWGRVVNATTRPPYPGNDPVPTVWGSGIQPDVGVPPWAREDRLGVRKI